MKEQELRAWAQQLATELSGLRQQRDQLETEIQQITKKFELVKQVLSLESGGELELAVDNKPSPTSVREYAKRILTDAGRPLHINEIHQSFRERGFPIPGGGTPFNILVHLSKEQGFVRVARGTYAIAGTVPEAEIVPTAPRRAHRRKRRTRRSKE